MFSCQHQRNFSLLGCASYMRCVGNHILVDMCCCITWLQVAMSQVHDSVFIPYSVSALLMMVTLKKLASTGCTLIFTIYQSSTEVFGLFDRICLLSNGNTLFFGETLACLQVSDVVEFNSFSMWFLRKMKWIFCLKGLQRESSLNKSWWFYVRIEVEILWCWTV